MTLLISVSWFLASRWAQFLGVVTVIAVAWSAAQVRRFEILTSMGIFDVGIPVV